MFLCLPGPCYAFLPLTFKTHQAWSAAGSHCIKSYKNNVAAMLSIFQTKDIPVLARSLLGFSATYIRNSPGLEHCGLSLIKSHNNNVAAMLSVFQTKYIP
jgi:hypothetical protein